jgi:Asp/Glu/hydantoin racemase
MINNVTGGQTTYGHVVGILMNDSTIPRIPGDPGHAETFSFPVIYEVLKGFPFEDLINIRKDNIDILIDRAKVLQKKGVSLIAADCGLFGPFHEELRRYLQVPFIGSALDMVPLLQRFLPFNRKVGIITGDTQILKPDHFNASGIDPETVLIVGMDNSSEFKRVVIEGNTELNIEKMRQDLMDTAADFMGENLGAVVLECTNLISFKIDLQKALRVPVFDLVTLIEWYVSGLRSRKFHSQFIR